MGDISPGHNSPKSAPQLLLPPIGMLVKLDRAIDRLRPCHDNLAVVHPGQAQHAAELKCNLCRRHRGWLPAEAFTFLTNVAGKFGCAEAVVLRDRQIGDHQMASGQQYDNTNRGVLFRNSDKDPDNEKDRDYAGELNVNGVEFWASGWIKTSKKGTKFLSLSIKPKNEKPAPSGKSRAADFDDEIPF